MRGRGERGVASKRVIQAPAHPTGIKRKGDPQRMIYPRPTDSRRTRDFERWRRYKKSLLERYDTNEYVRRENLTNSQHTSPTGEIGSEGFRRFTTVKNIPYDRDRSGMDSYGGKRRQYARQNEFPQSQNVLHSADQNVFRDKRDDGTKPLYAYSFKKKQPVVSELTGR